MQRVVERMLKAHPEPPVVAVETLSECIRACLECAQTCIACADACVVAQHPHESLMHCIRLTQDCADICLATVRVLSRQASPDLGLITMLVDVCLTACDACALECGRHAPYHMHCQICAQSCQHAADTCRRVVGAATEAARLHH